MTDKRVPREPTVAESHQRIVRGEGTPEDYLRVVGDPRQSVGMSCEASAMTDKRVPREPTDEMIRASLHTEHANILNGDWARVREQWRAMYDAAPAAPDERLLGRLRGAASAIALCPQMETRHGETCDLAYERIDALKAALRKHCVDNHMCHECNTFWGRVGDERHAPGCLAAPEDAP